MLKVGQLHLVTIEKMTLKGGGLGRVQGQVVFVPFAAPGDDLQVRITEVKKNFARGQIVEILKVSSFRTEPICPHFKKCGGCQWQHLDYSSQVEFKDQLLRAAVSHALSKTAQPEPQWLDFIKSPKPFGYRQRIRLKKLERQVGYYASRSHEFVPIKSCDLAHPALQIGIEKLRDEVSSGHLNTYEISLKNNQAYIQPVDGVEIAFSQVNPEVNTLVQETLRSWVTEYKRNFQERISYLDLYCGDGNLTFLVAEALGDFGQGWGVELSGAAIKRARDRALAQGLPEQALTFIHSDAKKFFSSSAFKKVQLVVVDPPRSGLEGQVVENLIKQKSLKMLIYMSCDLGTFARDTQLLTCPQSGWRLKKVGGYDMFAQTDHIELLALFERDS